MERSIAITAKIYPSLGQCIFCGSPDDLTDEHIVPFALSGIGEMLIRDGSCRTCNNYANEKYEQPALKADLLAVRNMLELKRRKRGSKQKPREMPSASFTAAGDGQGDEGFDISLAPDEFPPVFSWVSHPPAGILLGEDKAAGSPVFQMRFLHLGIKRAHTAPHQVVIRERRIMGGPEMVAAKMAYCYSVAERGIGYVECSELVDLLRGKRSDMFNFVGQPLKDERLAMSRLHNFYFRQRDQFETVIVHMFASFGGPKYEVVLGPIRKT